MKFIDRLGLRGLLSFPPDMPAFELEDLNVLIGPNGSGKSNVLEAFELLRATPTDFAGAIRDGGGAAEWLWKGEAATNVASMEIETGDQPFGLTNPPELPFRYRLEFVTANTRVEVSKDPDRYPELTWLGRQFGHIQMLRDWTIGRYTAPRRAQPADLPDDRLLPDCVNLALILNDMQHRSSRLADQYRPCSCFFCSGQLLELTPYLLMQLLSSVLIHVGRRRQPHLYPDIFFLACLP